MVWSFGHEAWFPNQGLNLHLLHWKVKSQPLFHFHVQGSPQNVLLKSMPGSPEG